MAKPFDPNEYVTGYQEASDVEHVQGEWTHPKDTTGSTDGYAKDAIIIGITGGEIFYYEGRPSSSFSVYLGPNNPWNWQSRVDSHVPLGPNDSPPRSFRGLTTSSVPHFWDRQQTSLLVRTLMLGIHGTPVRRVIIKSDSVFLAEVMSMEGVLALQANNWIGSDGMGSVNPLMLCFFLRTILRLDRLGLEIRFWRVSKDENREACRMSDEACGVAVAADAAVASASTAVS